MVDKFGNPLRRDKSHKTLTNAHLMDADEITQWQSDQYATALRRMKRADDRGTGCTLLPDMIRAMSNMEIGEWWGAVNEDGTSNL